LIRQQGIEICPCENNQQAIFVRPFDPKYRDALYVPLEKWSDFLCDPIDRFHQPDLLDLTLGINTDLTRLAVPEGLLRAEDGMASLLEIYRYFFNVKVLLIIVDPQPDFQGQCEFESAQRGAFIRDNDRGGFDFGDGERVGDETVYKLIEEVIDKTLIEALPQEFIRNFEIRLTVAVRR